MKYSKARANFLSFDNSDLVFTASDPRNNCGHQTSGNSCSNNGTQKFDNCPNMNHSHATDDYGPEQL